MQLSKDGRELVDEFNENWGEGRSQSEIRAEGKIKLSPGVTINDRFEEINVFSRALDLYEQADRSQRKSVLDRIDKSPHFSLEMKVANNPEEPDDLGEAISFIGPVHPNMDDSRHVVQAIEEGQPLNMTVVVNQVNSIGASGIAETINHEISLHCKADMDLYDSVKKKLSRGDSPKKIADYVRHAQYMNDNEAMSHLPLASTAFYGPDSRTKVMMKNTKAMLRQLDPATSSYNTLKKIAKEEVEDAEAEALAFASKLRRKHTLSDREEAMLEAIEDDLPSARPRAHR